MFSSPWAYRYLYSLETRNNEAQHDSLARLADGAMDEPDVPFAGRPNAGTSFKRSRLN